jgi:pimeloyl-ACP methyl ester carboxylesterase
MDVAYRVSDMAKDTVGLMDALGLERVHLAGISMGGMIVQQVAIQSPDRVLSITSVMSSTGETGLPSATPEAGAVLVTPAPTERAGYIEHTLRTNRVIGSPGFSFDEAWQREVANRVFDRAVDGAGVARQLAAVTVSGSRAQALSKLDVPALVIHGDGDPLLMLAHGEATAKAIPNAKLCVIPGMGHDLPRGAWPTIVGEITEHTRAAEA